MVSENDVRHIGDLARIHLRDDEVAPLTKNLEDIIAYVKQLENLDVTDVEPTSHVLPLKNVYREDEIKPSINRDLLLKTSVKEHNGFFQVPKVI
ncbi:Aspartyl-tRNA(Asn) amidotransferase subunit C @ Glutamyl-tRNA(Gln) amidotransferase subunit C [hydrothermal vent metagenome]|uniref:Aspartyl-tRNA(Asn) amidotransferase subunit C @ Glutamyl-tRNA(Gln) amidotransferase subunit C n=1 Tax=hydrothermal vent metagenome TaxID=652676 RepID=A0A3B1D095_9ZZZZ